MTKKETRMRQVGVTTVQRWLSEKVEWATKSYMESNGKLYELSTVTGINGGIGVTLLAVFKLHAGTFFAGQDGYTLQSPVYLYAGPDDLAGLAVDGIELAELGTTLARVSPEWAGGSRFNIAGTATGRVESGNMPRAVPLSTPCHPHCG
jgi:hypothetical protein